ncbi:MAG TPA: ectonucleotide pyrophosphatase/phosphodiesterase [Pyrinomonadaceae bacterium]|jgi:predicted AlkP superfamily pyrophosphatase or phosphodiesterase
MRRRGLTNLSGMLLVLCAASVLVAFACTRAVAQEQQRSLQDAKRVLVISLDGLDWRYVSSSHNSLKIPTLRRLMASGVSSSVVTVYPSVTYPAHTSIITGAYPARHGIFGNDIFDPSMLHNREWYWFARAIKVETLWDAAKRAGLSTAMVSWPVATGAGDHNVPEILKLGGKFPDTLALIKANARPQGLVEEIERTDARLYSNVNKDEQDDMRTRFAEYVIEHKRPQLMLMHLFDLDHFEHDFGPFTAEANAMLEKTDAYVARVLAAASRAGTLDETAVFIVSDHGFLPISQQINPGVLLERAGLLKVVEEKDAQGRTRTVLKEWRALPYTSSGSCAIILRDPKDTDALNRARAVFREFAEGKASAFPGVGKRSLRVLEARELRLLQADPRAALFLEAEDGYAFGNNYTGQPITSTNTRGTHGYLPSRYLNTFIASGAGIGRRGLLNGKQPVRMIDLGPTIARTLKLKLRDAQGKAFSLR